MVSRIHTCTLMVVIVAPASNQFFIQAVFDFCVLTRESIKFGYRDELGESFRDGFLVLQKVLSTPYSLPR